MKDWNLDDFAIFWTIIEIEEIMALYDKPLPTLILYSSDLLEGS